MYTSRLKAYTVLCDKHISSYSNLVPTIFLPLDQRSENKRLWNEIDPTGSCHDFKLICIFIRWSFPWTWTASRQLKNKTKQNKHNHSKTNSFLSEVLFAMFNFHWLIFYTDSCTGGSKLSRSILVPLSSVLLWAAPSPCISISLPTIKKKKQECLSQ